jgi:hypothetical protein
MLTTPRTVAMPRYTVTLSLQPPAPPEPLDVRYHRALADEIAALIPEERQRPSSLTAGLYRIRISLAAETEEHALVRAREVAAAAAASARRALHPEAHVDVRSAR